MDTIVKMNNLNAHRLADYYSSKLQELQMLIHEETKDTGYDGYDFSKLIALVGEAQTEANKAAISLEDSYNDRV